MKKNIYRDFQFTITCDASLKILYQNMHHFSRYWLLKGGR